MTVEIVKELTSPDWKGQVVLVRKDDDYYVVSSVDWAFDTGLPETLAFRSDSEGNVDDWTDVAGGVEKTREETIQQIEDGDLAEFRMFEDDRVDPLSVLLNSLNNR